MTHNLWVIALLAKHFWHFLKNTFLDKVAANENLMEIDMYTKAQPEKIFL